MDPITALHNGARDYCIRRHAHWSTEYAAVISSGRDRITKPGGSWTYTDASYRIFPRYNVLAAILTAVERYVPSDFASVAEARALLGAAAWSAGDDFTTSVSSVATAAMVEEREAFARFVEESTPAEWSAITMLPFRRVLAPSERDTLFERFESRWGVWYGGYCTREPVEQRQHVTLHVDWVAAVPQREETIRTLLRGRDITRVIALCELGASSEVDLALATFHYGGGGEGFWCDHAMEWMIYVSHESSITFGGEWLITAVSATVPDLSHYTYRGWEHPPNG